jgi:hypothetical protein
MNEMPREEMLKVIAEYPAAAVAKALRRFGEERIEDLRDWRLVNLVRMLEER